MILRELPPPAKLKVQFNRSPYQSHTTGVERPSLSHRSAEAAWCPTSFSLSKPGDKL